MTLRAVCAPLLVLLAAAAFAAERPSFVLIVTDDLGVGQVLDALDKSGLAKNTPAVQLYNLTSDVGQSRNVAAAETARASAMGRRLEALAGKRSAARQK